MAGGQNLNARASGRGLRDLTRGAPLIQPSREFVMPVIDRVSLVANTKAVSSVRPDVRGTGNTRFGTGRSEPPCVFRPNPGVILGVTSECGGRLGCDLQFV